jgi:hypothetical protein
MSVTCIKRVAFRGGEGVVNEYEIKRLHVTHKVRFIGLSITCHFKRFLRGAGYEHVVEQSAHTHMSQTSGFRSASSTVLYKQQLHTGRFGT